MYRWSSMFEWYTDLSPWWRYGVAIALLATSTILWLMGIRWLWGWVVGGVLFAFAGRSESEKKGYRF